MLIVLLLAPFCAAVSIALLRKRNVIELTHGVATLVTLTAGVSVAAQVWLLKYTDGSGASSAWSGFLRADALSALAVMTIVFVSTISAVFAIGYTRAELKDEALSKVRLFFALYHLFIFSMLLAVTTDNLGVMWVAIEGTTLSTVFLVTLHNTPTSVEAGYKYLIISSVGLALAFCGTVLMFLAAAHLESAIALNWTSLLAAAPSLQPAIVKLAFVFILVGYGTKAGLAPMHTWLPDAHSEAPAPISAVMSGVLLNVGLYALLRFKAVADRVLGSGFSSQCLVGFGLLSVAVGAVFLVSQRNYKRMLAYSSVEHMGIACLGFGFGGYWGLLGGVWHIMNHALAKSMLFILSGSIFLKYRTTEIRKVRGLLHSAPWTGVAFLIATLALVGLPPFGIFISEFMIFRAGLTSHYTGAVMVGIIFAVLAFAGVLSNLNQMLYGSPVETEHGAPLRWPLSPVLLNVLLLLVFGLTIPPGLGPFLNRVVSLLGALI